jgi:hypothetical protein
MKRPDALDSNVQVKESMRESAVVGCSRAVTRVVRVLMLQKRKEGGGGKGVRQEKRARSMKSTSKLALGPSLH